MNFYIHRTVRIACFTALIAVLTLNLFASSFIPTAAATGGQTIELNKSLYKAGETITVKYYNASANGKDWVGVYPAGTTPASANPALVWKYAPSGSGSLDLVKSLAPGNYEAIYLSNGGYDVLFRVTFQVIPVRSITLDKNKFETGEPILVTYEAAAANGKDWIGIYPEGGIPGVTGGSWLWDYAKPGDGKLTLDSELEAGNYEIFYLANDGYQILDRKRLQIFDRVPAIGVVLAQSRVRMSEGETKSLSAAILPSDATSTEMTWTSSDPSVASVSETGESVTLTGHAAGTAIVTVQTTDGGFTDSATVRVDPVGYVNVTGVTIDMPSVTMEKGDIVHLTATVEPADATNQEIIWTSSKPGAVAITANADGTATVQAIRGGVVDIHATSADDEDYYAISHIIVEQPVTGIELEADDVQLFAGQATELHAIITPDDALNQNVSWSSSDESIVRVTGFPGTTDGFVQAVRAGTATITVRTEDGDFARESTINVTPAPANNEEVLYLNFDDQVADSSIYKTKVKTYGPAPVYVPGKMGGALQLQESTVTKATYLDLGMSSQFQFGSDTDYSFAFWVKIPDTGNGDIPIISNKDASLASNTGWNISVAGAVIRASYTAEGHARTIMNMGGVADNEWHHVIFSYKRDGMASFYRDGVKAASYDISSLVGDVDTGLTPKIGVDGLGKLTGKSNVMLDELRIFRKAIDPAEANSLFRDGQIFVEGITLDLTNVDLNQGQTAQLEATLTPANPDNANVNWTSSNPNVASVTAGADGTAIVKGISGGTARITATTADGGYTVFADVTVIGRSTQVTGVKLDANVLDIRESQSAQLHAAITPGGASNPNVVWRTTDSSIVQVTPLPNSRDAVVEGLRPGIAVVQVLTQDGVYKDEAVVTVTDMAGFKPVLVHMSFNRNSRDIVRGIEAAVHGNPAYVPGRTSSAIVLDTPEQYVDLIDRPLANLKDFAVSFWMKSADDAGKRVLLSNMDQSDTAGNTGWYIGLENGGLRWSIKSSDSAPLEYELADAADDEWHHFAISVDQLDNMIDFYKDGRFEGSLDISGLAGEFDSGLPIKMGADGKGKASGEAKVEIDELQIFNTSILARDVNRLFSLLPDPANDATPVITLNGEKVMAIEWGGTYTESGATARDEVDGDLTSSIAVTGTVNTDQAGTYTLKYNVANSGWNTATAVRTVYVRKQGGTDPGTPPSGGQGENQNPGNTTPPIEGEGESSTPSTGGENEKTDTVTLNLETDAAVAKHTDKDGRSVTKVSLYADKLSKAFSSARTGLVIVEIKDTDPVIMVEIPTNALKDAAGKKAGAIIQIVIDGVKYNLPVKLSDNMPSNQTVTVSIKKVSDQTIEAIKGTLKEQDRQLMGTPIEFNMSLEGKEMTDFNGIYLDRTLSIKAVLDPGKASAVWIDANNEIHFIPSVISNKNGSAEVVIRSPHNSIYAVVQSDKHFADLQGHWAKTDVELLANKFIVKGATDASFVPDNRITRAEFAALLVRSLGLIETESDPSFTDVRSTDWYAGSVGAARKAGIVSGYEDGAFKPDESITREQIVTMIVRALKVGGKEVKAEQQVLDQFADRASIASWAQDAVSQSVKAGIVQGMTDTIFGAKQNATRAQSAALLKRMLQVLEFIN